MCWLWFLCCLRSLCYLLSFLFVVLVDVSAMLVLFVLFLCSFQFYVFVFLLLVLFVLFFQSCVVWEYLCCSWRCVMFVFVVCYFGLFVLFVLLAL